MRMPCFRDYLSCINEKVHNKCAEQKRKCKNFSPHAFPYIRVTHSIQFLKRKIYKKRYIEYKNLTRQYESYFVSINVFFLDRNTLYKTSQSWPFFYIESRATTNELTDRQINPISNKFDSKRSRVIAIRTFSHYCQMHLNISNKHFRISDQNNCINDFIIKSFNEFLKNTIELLTKFARKSYCTFPILHMQTTHMINDKSQIHCLSILLGTTKKNHPI